MAPDAQKLTAFAAASAAGAIAFPAALGATQHLVFRPLRLHAHTPVLGSILGFSSVFAAGVVASNTFNFTRFNYPAISSWFVNLRAGKVLTAEAALEATKQWAGSLLRMAKDVPAVASATMHALKSVDIQHLKSITAEDLKQFAVNQQSIIISGLVGVVMFRILGGRFRSALPSNLRYPGAFSRSTAFIPAKGQQYITTSERIGNERLGIEGLNDFGRRYGCHSCGRRRVDTFIGDHMPPNKYARPGETQRLYPQCPSCSQKQSVAVRTDSTKLVTHGLALRWYHLWLPLAPLINFTVGQGG